VRSPSPSSRPWSKVLGALVAVVLVVAPAVSYAERSGNNPAKERAAVRAKKAQVAGQVDGLKATDAQVERALADLEANLAGQERMLAEAQRAAAQAEEARLAAIAAVEAKKAEIEALRADVRDFLVEAYVHPPGDDALAALDTDDPGEAAERRALLEMQNTKDADLLDRLSAAQEDLEVQQSLAEEASERAASKKAQVADRLNEVKQARDQQAALEDEVEARLDHALSEAASLEALDQQLSAQIRAEQEALARRSRGGSGGGGGGGPIGNVSTGIVNCPSGGRLSVATSIVDNVQALLNAAASDGVMLCGGGYRSSAGQIEARKRNGCPDIYNSPPSSCSPPTARPGTSMHERGLAIDFTCEGGGVISSRSSPCFQWLAANAGGYGLRNLPSEPWHWSTNGQ
jgi:hypothetical protein